MNPQN